MTEKFSEGKILSTELNDKKLIMDVVQVLLGKTACKKLHKILPLEF